MSVIFMGGYEIHVTLKFMFSAAICTEEQCATALESARWPNGFHYPRCGRTRHSVLKCGSRKTFQCSHCRYQTSLIAGTLFQGTYLLLTLLFLAIYPISQAKTGISAFVLSRQLGVS
ncbi:transposase [Acidithiobacillus thiooxidans]|uniref:Transposase zinc-ribbon domain-containing protein n=1 Tax=Acidithiobacillus thiooxidans ATCC 19377 TaxID=637390 RepID=A0A5P9XRL0_ACITH|nr:transposase [Acidithiobacillus sp. HP-11]MBU2741531.1 transposase [Acidithiobacillus albertensis]MBU2752074.1 transposase [Acidithiobacillus thiooxidans]QFX96269.1 hypothetical protein GCD22_02015 [Acidithiobacillus thiooxidans ATCC 19377]MBU2791994.1 transposase [Acidithiobacillus thiooxidans]